MLRTFLILICATIFEVLCCQNDTHCPNITIAVLMERFPGTEAPFNFERSIGTVELAKNKSREILRESAHLNFIVRYADVTGCTALQWGALAADIYHNNDIHAIVGPVIKQLIEKVLGHKMAKRQSKQAYSVESNSRGCSDAVKTVSRMAVKWNIPHFTYIGISESLANKHEFQMLSRLSYTMDLFAKFYIQVFRAFHWTNIANIYCTNYLTKLVGTNLQRRFEHSGLTSTALPVLITAPDLRTVLHQAREVARVFVVACEGDIFRDLVLLAQNMGMSPGEYVFIFFYSFANDPPVGKYTWERGDELDMEAKKAYESVMVVTPRRPTTEEFFEFEKQAMGLSSELYDYQWPEGSELNVCDIGQYDSFILYALALNDTLRDGDDPRDGVSVVNRMWNRTFPGIGGLVYMNENGDRDTDFTLLDMEPSSGKWRVVAQYLGYKHMFELLDDAPIHWPGDRGPAVNRPACGYVGELCETFSLPTYATVAIVLSGVILLVMAIGGYLYWRVKAEAAIHSEWWRINWHDITLQTRFSSFSSCSTVQNDATPSVTQSTTVFQTVGIFKGMQVHLQKPDIKSLSVDRHLLMELKQMRDITCPNLTRLIGLCPDSNNVCIITEYCSRGSLQDILHNEAIQLDWDFRISLINDIVQGLYYLHTSPIHVHGRLTSSRCVIDSRFVLKITGFGLNAIENCEATSRKSKQQTNPYRMVSDLLWMAPEQLRVYPTRRFTQPGDVYSFAIILYEMCTRTEPYVTEPWYISIEETVNEIKREGTRIRRPCLTDQHVFPDLIKLIEDCWSESPRERPTIGLVRKICLSLKRGTIHGKNVLDALLHRMEQYANNLEGLVAERTNALLEEKKKSEELLYQVLPKSVADQLRNGLSVVPEAYESVTIFFSDIVGFTNICAASTPLEVVDFLNDIYVCFDKIIENFKVYKVETIGDSYMVVSGLPARNDKDHAREIARMSLSILEQVELFIIRHQPGVPLRARVGVHTGPVCAGVVGRKMPRYCLFGDTVNVASRMESNGEGKNKEYMYHFHAAMRIQISETTKQCLEQFGTFVTKERGTIDIKGKGPMKTFWLKDEITEC